MSTPFCYTQYIANNSMMTSIAPGKRDNLLRQSFFNVPFSLSFFWNFREWRQCYLGVGKAHGQAYDEHEVVLHDAHVGKRTSRFQRLVSSLLFPRLFLRLYCCHLEQSTGLVPIEKRKAILLSVILKWVMVLITSYYNFYF